MNKDLVVRKAALQDSKAIYDLSNEKSVRDASFDSRPISWENHTQWFEAIIHNPECEFFIAEYNGEFAGQLRFIKKSEEATVSISVTSRFRGLGIAETFYWKALKHLRDSSHTERIIAKIKTGNYLSQAFFKKLGFHSLPCKPSDGADMVVMMHDLGR